MATIQEITQRIAASNAESKRLNNERNVNLGKKETLTAQLNNALARYSQQYGVALTVDNLEAETKRVLEEKEKETVKVETMIGLIKAGRYEEAEQIANPDAIQPTQQVQNVEPIQPIQQVKNVESIQPTQTVNTANVQPTSIPNVSAANVQPIQPIPTVSNVEPIQPTHVQPEPVLPNLSEDIMPEPVAPTHVEPKKEEKIELPNLKDDLDILQGFQSGEPAPISPTKTEPTTPPDLTGVTNFEAILGGKAFKA